LGLGWYCSTIFDLCAIGWWVVSYTARPLHPPPPRPEKSATSTHWIGRWVGPRAAMHAVGENSLAPAGNRTPDVQPVARRYTDWAMSAPANELTIKLGLWCLFCSLINDAVSNSHYIPSNYITRVNNLKSVLREVVFIFPNNFKWTLTEWCANT
jgi:hypothetical protein